MSSPRVRGNWQAALAERGFSVRDGRWSHGELRAVFAGGWLVFERPAAALDLLMSDADWPGPWRLVSSASGLVRVLELPPALVAQIERSPDERDTALATVDWALASQAAASTPEPLAGPATPPDPTWAVRSGPVLAQVRALHGDAGMGDVRLGLELPLTMRPSADLQPTRAAWMRALLLDARARWRLVRCLLVGGTPVLRVDLRGVPEALDERLTSAALDALRHVGERLLEPLDLILDPGLDSRALAAGGFAPDRSSARARPASTRRERPALSRD